MQNRLIGLLAMKDPRCQTCHLLSSESGHPGKSLIDKGDDRVTSLKRSLCDHDGLIVIPDCSLQQVHILSVVIPLTLQNVDDLILCLVGLFIYAISSVFSQYVIICNVYYF